MAKSKTTEAAADTKPPVVRALDALGTALADHGHTWTDEQRALYERAVELAQLQQDAIDRIADFAFGSDRPAGPADAAIEEIRTIARSARGA